jgi:hypothetical protein
MSDVEHRRRLAGKPPMKYHGKWPFLRVLGMQEVASVLFSIANLVVHLYGFDFLTDKINALKKPSSSLAAAGGESLAPPPKASSRAAYPFLWLWRAYTVMHLNAWVWSAIFHTRDTRLTERLDYCSAIAVVVAGER